MEKLLRACDVESIYILIRNKKNDDIHTRIGKIFDDPVSGDVCSFFVAAISVKLLIVGFEILKLTASFERKLTKNNNFQLNILAF